MVIITTCFVFSFLNKLVGFLLFCLFSSGSPTLLPIFFGLLFIILMNHYAWTGRYNVSLIVAFVKSYLLPQIIFMISVAYLSDPMIKGDLFFYWNGFTHLTALIIIEQLV